MGSGLGSRFTLALAFVSLFPALENFAGGELGREVEETG